MGTKDAFYYRHKWEDECVKSQYLRAENQKLREALERISGEYQFSAMRGAVLTEKMYDIARAALAADPAPKQEVCCEWSAPYQRGYSTVRDTACGDLIERIYGKFCPYCGRPIKIKEGGE